MNKSTYANVILIIVSALLTLCLAEVFYRGKLHYLNDAFGRLHTYRVIQEAHGIYSQEFGIEYVPGSQARILNITDGKVTWCPEGPLSITNKDGLNGTSTYDDYSQAQYKIAVFGDSFTHWNQQGETWPDLLQRELSTATELNVVSLNYGRGGYGILQMLDLAGREVPKVRPDLTILAFIGGDLTRDRWWVIDSVVNGIRRDFISPDKKEEFNVSSSSDRWIVEPNASPSWCERAIKSSLPDSILSSITDKYAKIRGGSERVVYTPTSLTVIYLFNRLYYGYPFPDAMRPRIPRHTYDDFSDDSQAMDNAKKIIESSGEILLVHLPTRKEIIAGHYLSRENNILAKSLESMFHRNIVYLGDSIQEPELLGKIDLLPHDGHPNFDGILLYARKVSEHILDSLLVQDVHR